MRNKGISLIVLVITIIIMIIIAATIVISLSNSNIISKANQAVEETNMATIADAAALKYGEVMADIKTGKLELNLNQAAADGTTIGEYIRNLLIEDGTIAADQMIIINEAGGLEKVINEKSTENGGPWIIGGGARPLNTTGYNLNNNIYFKTIRAGDDAAGLEIAEKPGGRGLNTVDTVVITGYQGQMPSNLVIPNYIDGKRVEGLAFSEGHTNQLDASALEAMTISYGIKSIMDFIGDFSNLTEIYISNTVGIIDSDAFINCPNLTTIKIDRITGSILGSPGAWGAPLDVNVIWSGRPGIVSPSENLAESESRIRNTDMAEESI